MTKKAGVAELNPRMNQSVNSFFQFIRQGIFIILVAICVIITIGTHIRMNGVVDAMSDIKAGYEVNIRDKVDSETDLKKEVRLLQQKADRLEAKIIALTGEH